MNTIAKLALIAGVGMMGLMNTALAQVPITVTLGGTQHLWDEDRDLNDEFLPMGAVEYRFGKNWAAELTYSAGEADVDGGPGDADIDFWHVGGLYYITPQESLHPYLAFGAGELKRDFDAGSESDTQVNVGAGFRYYLTERWNWRADARVLYANDDSVTDLALTLGISYSFAPPPRSKPAPAAPVAVAAVPAAPVERDSDRDGVLDKDDLCPGTPAHAKVDASGCEVKREEVASIRLKVNFAFDSDVVQDRYQAELRELAEFLQKYESLHVEIEGHTDDRGPDTYNETLSQRRADAVAKELVNTYGIAAHRVKARGYGEAQPVDSNDTDAGRAENRRVMATLKE